MSEQLPPNPFPLNPIFNPNDWLYDNEPLTIAEADKRYLKYPNAQGTENLQAINVNGLATFNDGIIGNMGASFITSLADAVFIVDSTNPVNKTLIYESGANFYLTNDNNSGSINFGTRNGSGVPTYPLSATSTQVDVYTQNGATSTASLEINDNNTKIFYFIPNTNSGAYNPASDAGNESIIVRGASKNTETLELSTWSDTTSAVKVAPTSVSIVAGGTSTTGSTSVVCDGTNVIVKPNVKFPDNSIQSNAYTGAGILAGSYTNTNMTIDANGKITALANGSSTIPANLTLNSLNIVATSGNGAGAGINNPYNTNGRKSFSGSGGYNNGGVNAFVANSGIQFDFNNGGATTPSGAIMKYRITFTFFNGSNWGETACNIDFYPDRWTQGQKTGNQIYNINNKINGNGNYSMSDTTYAPSGRQYWTYNQSFSGVSGANALFIAHNGYFDLYFCIPDNSYTWSGCIEALDTTAVSTGSQGITIEVI